MITQLSVKLKPFTKTDIEQLIAWTTSAEFLLQWAGPALHYPLDQVQLLQHLAEVEQADLEHLIFKAVNSETGETVGHGELMGIDRSNLSAKIARILVGPPELRGHGIGERIVRELLRIAFEVLSLHRVTLNVFDFNKSAIRCYEKVGFQQEGILREARKHGNKYWNVCIMSILEYEFLETRA